MKLFFAITMLWAVSFMRFCYVNGSSLVIEINGFRNDNGFVFMSLFNSEAGFPGSAEKAYLKLQALVKNGKCVVSIPALPEGTYAIAVLHDENKNLKMDMKLLALPKEGFGFSQDAAVILGLPKFSKASFKHTGDQRILINMRYF